MKTSDFHFCGLFFRHRCRPVSLLVSAAMARSLVNATHEKWKKKNYSFRIITKCTKNINRNNFLCVNFECCIKWQWGGRRSLCGWGWGAGDRVTVRTRTSEHITLFCFHSTFSAITKWNIEKSFRHFRWCHPICWPPQNQNRIKKNQKFRAQSKWWLTWMCAFNFQHTIFTALIRNSGIERKRGWEW